MHNKHSDYDNRLINQTETVQALLVNWEGNELSKTLFCILSDILHVMLMWVVSCKVCPESGSIS